MSDQHLSTEQLQQFLDLSLQDSVASEHLAACVQCTSRLKEVERLYALLNSIEDEPLQRDLSPSVVAVIRKRKSAQVRVGWLVVLEGILAFLVAVLIAPTLIDQYGSAKQLFARMPDSEALTSPFFGTWEALRESVLNLTQGFSFDVLEIVNSIAGYPWVWLMAAAALLWVGGNGLMLRLYNRAE
jgi:anti-sigma factor RsiW